MTTTNSKKQPQGAAVMFQPTFADTGLLNLADPLNDMSALGKNRIDHKAVSSIVEKRYDTRHIVFHGTLCKPFDIGKLFCKIINQGNHDTSFING